MKNLDHENSEESVLLTLFYQLSLQDYIETKDSGILSFGCLLFLFWLSAVSYGVMAPDLLEDINFFSRDKLSIFFYSTITASAILAIIFHSKYSFIYHWNAKRSWRRSELPKKPLCLQFSEIGVTEISDNKEQKNEWEQYMRYEEKDTLFLVYFFAKGIESYHIIPKRSLSSEEELLILRKILKEKVMVGY